MVARYFVLLALALYTQSILFKTEVDSNQAFCVFEVLGLDEKYSFAVSSSSQANFDVNITKYSKDSQTAIFYKNVSSKPFNARADKISQLPGTYQMCFKNYGQYRSEFEFQVKLGIELLELSELPTDTDSENLDREIKWLRNQTSSLDERSGNIEKMRFISKQVAEMIGTKMIIFAIIGLSIIGGVNFFFFKSLKRTFKDRKLI